MRSPFTTATAIAVITFFTCCNSANSKPPAGIDKGAIAEATDPSGSGNPGGGKTTNLIDWQVRADHAYYLRDAANDPYLYISLKSGESEERHTRQPLNISLVLDRSGSMAGEKIAYLRRAAKFVIDQLDSRDILSIVNYDNIVEVMSPSAPVRNKEALKALIDRIADRGNTNLSGGMLEGYTQVAITKRGGYINRVLLLTDGLANEGIVDPVRLKSIVQKKLRTDGIAISTFGLGAGYNEDLLTGMAEVGGANYYFIDKAERIPEIFSRELKGLLSVVAQNAVLTIDLPRGVHCEKVYGYNYEERDNHVSIRLNDIYAHDEKGILVKLDRYSPTQPTLIDCTLSYTDANTAEDVRSHKSITLNPTENRNTYTNSEDHTVSEMIALFQSTEEFDEAMLAADKGDYATAQSRTEVTIKRLKAQQAVRPSAKLKAQEEKLESYKSGVGAMPAMNADDRSMYQKSNKAANYEVKKMKK